MKIPTLEYPVYDMERYMLLPAGARLTPETLDAVIASYKGPPYKSFPLMEYGTVNQDILRLLRNPPYNRIFSEPEKETSMSIMEKVHFIPPVIESLNYFKDYDYYTYRHILIVFGLATIMANVLLEDSKDQVIEAMAGQVHDFGKICVPLPVLKKSNPLTRTERGVLEHHALAGFVLLSYLLQDSRSFAAQIAKEHHERRDGSGYPLGIRLKDPMVELICACDIYDALLSSRPYRLTPYQNRTALEEITEMAREGKLSWQVVKTLISLNRADKPHFKECRVSAEKRGTPPVNNIYGTIVEDDADSGNEKDE